MSHGVTRDDLRAWLEERFSDVLEEGQLSLIGLVHFSANGTETAVHAATSKLPSDKWAPGPVSEMMDAIASRFARGLQGVQQFALIATYGNSGKPRTSLPFQRMGVTNFGPLPGGGLGTEGVHPAGIVATGTRWGELAIQQAGAKDQLITQLLGQLLDKAYGRLETVEKRSDERWSALQQLLLSWQQQSASLQTRALMIEFGKRLLPLAPAVLSTLTGSDAIVPPSAAEASVFDGLVESYSSEQLQELLAAMPRTEGGGAVGALVADQLLRAKKRKDARDRAAAGTSRTYDECEADAAGEAMAIRALRGGAEPANAIDAKANGTNGANGGDGHKPPSPRSDDSGAQVLRDLFQAFGPQAESMIGLVQGTHPELAERIRRIVPATKEGVSHG